jgi:exopolyphosphatase/pppGpp-phosphohydrolase
MTDIDHDILRVYTRARATVAPGEPLTLIEIGRERTTLVSGKDDTARDAIALHIGFVKTAKEFFQHNPPTPRELEDAIATIEDELARARAIVVNDSMLITTDKVVLEIVRTAGIGSVSGPMLSIEVVEQLYQRLAAVSSGAPPTQEETKLYAVHAATIVILREAMHHLRYAAIRVIT